MKKPLMEKLLKENDLGDRMMLGGSYTAGGGVINTGASTFSSPDSSQNPDAFKSSGFSPGIKGSATNIDTNFPEDAENATSNTSSLDKTNKDVDAIKYKVTPDDVLCGITAELKKQTFKRVDVAKKKVIENLKKNPRYYRDLDFLNINDDQVDESYRKYMNPQEIAIADIIKDMKIKNSKRGIFGHL